MNVNKTIFNNFKDRATTSVTPTTRLAFSLSIPLVEKNESKYTPSPAPIFQPITNPLKYF